MTCQLHRLFGSFVNSSDRLRFSRWGHSQRTALGPPGPGTATAQPARTPHHHLTRSHPACPTGAPGRSHGLRFYFTFLAAGSCCSLCLKRPLLACLVNVHTSIHTGPAPPTGNVCSELPRGVISCHCGRTPQMCHSDPGVPGVPTFCKVASTQ